MYNVKQLSGESLVVREAPSGWGPCRFAATPRAWLRRADGTTQEILFADQWGWTADEAEAKAQQAVEAWKRSKRAAPGCWPANSQGPAPPVPVRATSSWTGRQRC